MSPLLPNLPNTPPLVTITPDIQSKSKSVIKLNFTDSENKSHSISGPITITGEVAQISIIANEIFENLNLVGPDEEATKKLFKENVKLIATNDGGFSATRFLETIEPNDSGYYSNLDMELEKPVIEIKHTSPTPPLSTTSKETTLLRYTVERNHINKALDEVREVKKIVEDAIANDKELKLENDKLIPVSKKLLKTGTMRSNISSKAAVNFLYRIIVKNREILTEDIKATRELEELEELLDNDKKGNFHAWLNGTKDILLSEGNIALRNYHNKPKTSSRSIYSLFDEITNPDNKGLKDDFLACYRLIFLKKPSRDHMQETPQNLSEKLFDFLSNYFDKCSDNQKYELLILVDKWLSDPEIHRNDHAQTEVREKIDLLLKKAEASDLQTLKNLAANLKIKCDEITTGGLASPQAEKEAPTNNFDVGGTLEQIATGVVSKALREECLNVMHGTICKMDLDSLQNSGYEDFHPNENITKAQQQEHRDFDKLGNYLKHHLFIDSSGKKRTRSEALNIAKFYLELSNKFLTEDPLNIRAVRVMSAVIDSTAARIFLSENHKNVRLTIGKKDYQKTINFISELFNSSGNSANLRNFLKNKTSYIPFNGTYAGYLASQFSPLLLKHTSGDFNPNTIKMIAKINRDFVNPAIENVHKLQERSYIANNQLRSSIENTPHDENYLDALDRIAKYSKEAEPVFSDNTFIYANIPENAL